MHEEQIRLNPRIEAESEDTFLQGVKDCIPTLLGYWSIGFAAGVIEQTAGLSVAEIALLSLLLYAGSAQFIAAGMIASSPPSVIVITIFFVNLRHLLLSAALSPYLRHLSPLRNMGIGALLTDETFGVAMNKALVQPRLSERWMHGLNVAAYLNWLFANLAGAYLGRWITDPERFGLDYALPAMFIGLLVLMTVSRKQVAMDSAVAVLAALIAIAVSLSLGGSWGVIAATVTASAIGVVIERWKR
ncbi:AzlC family ABC transporter permease [Paenibacillus thermoaerophilus]|uniref:AzlC family ABC transporter permease n=1 Tax=Paenibacillus thermoaerophilus TaxID=1215385 RepID=A0ABW2V989_9BACL|nr:AzlC family ABC transporter permease [Paenibacillus thermoaerophilus]TMV08423.1 AzlC family ABC transporter permease [Paenibacillus thermoaerophilus]